MAKKYASLDTLRTFLENLKTHFASTTEIDEIKEAKADWNQNDETAIDYVKNRTHYEDMYCDTVNGVYQSSTESLCCSISGIDLANGGSLTLQAEESGVRYNFSIDPSSVSTGTTEGVTTFGEYTVNFKKMINRQNGKYICSFLILPYSETMTATATYSYLLDVKQLDEKFIPDTIARTTDIESTYATKTDLENIDLSAYETAENAQLKFDEAKAYADTVASAKANTSHTHDDRYYTETEVDSKLAGKADKTHNHDSAYDIKGSANAVQSNLNTVNDNLEAHIDNADIHFTATERTKLSGIAAGAQVNTITGVKGNSESSYRTGNINITKSNIGLGNVDNTADANKTVKHATTADSAASATKATQDASGNVITSTYETKTGTDNKISVHNTSTSAHSDIRLLIAELTTKLNNFLDVDDTTTDQLSELIALIQDNATDIEAITSGKVSVSDIVNNLTTNVTNKPLSAAQGVAIKVLIDALDSALDAHDANTAKHITSTERTNWNAAKTHADSAHAPSNAEKNQNAFSNIKVGSTTIMADAATDTLELVGSNITITPDATNDKVTLAVANGTTSAKGVVQLTNSTSSTSTTTAATPNSVKSAYDLANTAKTNATTAQTKADSAYSLAESKADKNHTHSWSDLQNKPFGDEIESEETLMSNKTISMYGDGWYRITPIVELIEGITYKVTFNGATYESVAWVSPTTGTICIGNGEIYGGEDYGNWSAPFAFEYDNGTFSLYSNDIGSATFSIVKVVADVTKLDDRFIPDTIARTSNVSQVQIITYEADD